MTARAVIARYAQAISDRTCEPHDIPAQDRYAVQEELVRRYLARKVTTRVTTLRRRGPKHGRPRSA